MAVLRQCTAGRQRRQVGEEGVAKEGAQADVLVFEPCSEVPQMRMVWIVHAQDSLHKHVQFCGHILGFI
jgi:hypothetical protein